MLLVDIGNTDTVFSFSSVSPLLRLRTLVPEGLAFYSYKLKQFILEHNIPHEAYKVAAFSSVVPPMNQLMHSVLKELCGEEPLHIKAGDHPKVKVEIDHPHELGSDIYCNCVAAFLDCKQACIIVDFGTALTVTAVNSHGAILGVAIAPGIGTAVKSLFNGTAQLPEVPLEVPKTVIGRNTTHAIQSGIMIGYEGLVRNLIDKFKNEIDSPTKVYATGGMSGILPGLQSTFDVLSIGLTLKGITQVAQWKITSNTL